jgi:hypothetical protein
MRITILLPATIATVLAAGTALASTGPTDLGFRPSAAAASSAQATAESPRIVVAKRKQKGNDDPAGSEVEHPQGDDRLGTAPDASGGVRGGGADDDANEVEDNSSRSTNSGRSANSGRGSTSSGRSGGSDDSGRSGSSGSSGRGGSSGGDGGRGGSNSGSGSSGGKGGKG